MRDPGEDHHSLSARLSRHCKAQTIGQLGPHLQSRICCPGDELSSIDCTLLTKTAFNSKYPMIKQHSQDRSSRSVLDVDKHSCWCGAESWTTAAGALPRRTNLVCAISPQRRLRRLPHGVARRLPTDDAVLASGIVTHYWKIVVAFAQVQVSSMSRTSTKRHARPA